MKLMRSLTSADDTGIRRMRSAAGKVEEEGSRFHNRALGEHALVASAVYPSKQNEAVTLTIGCVSHCNGSYKE